MLNALLSVLKLAAPAVVCALLLSACVPPPPPPPVPVPAPVPMPPAPAPAPVPVPVPVPLGPVPR